MGRFARGLWRLGRSREYKGPPRELLPPAERALLDARSAQRTVRFFAVAVFVAVVGAVFAYTVASERNQYRLSSSGSTNTSAAPATVPPDTFIGPPANTDIGAYLDERRQVLAIVTGERLAVVSLDAYVTEADARAVIGSLPVDALLVAAPGAHPSVVTNGLEAWAASQREADEAEREEIRKLLPTVTDAVFKEFYEQELVRLDAAIENASAANPVVFGLVVRGPADALRALAGTAGVRLVDVSDGPGTAPGATYSGLRPEETTKAGQPPTRPV